MAPNGRKRGKVKIQRIMDERKRDATLRKRLPGLVKKTEELSILCDVPACLVAYRPDRAEPVVWPSQTAAAAVVRKYRAVPDLNRYKNELAGTEFVKQKNDKLRTKLSEVQLQCREEETKVIASDYIAGRRGSLDDLPIDLLVSVGSMAESKLHAIRARLQEIRSGGAPAPALLPPPPPASENVQMVETLGIMQPPLLQNDAMMLDPFNVAGHGSAFPTTEEMHALFLHAGLFSPPLPNPSFDP